MFMVFSLNIPLPLQSSKLTAECFPLDHSLRPTVEAAHKSGIMVLLAHLKVHKADSIRGRQVSKRQYALRLVLEGEIYAAILSLFISGSQKGPTQLKVDLPDPNRNPQRHPQGTSLPSDSKSSQIEDQEPCARM